MDRSRRDLRLPLRFGTRAALAAAAVLAAALVGVPHPAAQKPAAAQEGRRVTVKQLNQSREGKWRGPFFFVHLTDPQFGMMSQNKGWSGESDLLARAAREINRLRPRFVVVTGDMTNAGPGDPKRDRQLAAYRRSLRLIDPEIPVIHAAGNHDLGNAPTPESLAAYRAAYGPDRFTFWVGGVCFIVLNSCLIHDPSKAPDEAEAQDRWLTEALEGARRAGARDIIVFQHHPWFIEKVGEEDRYENIPRARRLQGLHRLREAGVAAVFSGHLHRNASSWYGPMELVVSSAVGMPLGKDPSGLRIVEVYGERIAHRYHGLADVPAGPPVLAAR